MNDMHNTEQSLIPNCDYQLLYPSKTHIFPDFSMVPHIDQYTEPSPIAWSPLALWHCGTKQLNPVRQGFFAETDMAGEGGGILVSHNSFSLSSLSLSFHPRRSATQPLPDNNVVEPSQFSDFGPQFKTAITSLLCSSPLYFDLMNC